MKINSVSNTSFGRISGRAINTVRRQAEGYLPEEHAYSANPAYKMMTPEQLKRLDSLTKRASGLNKTIITQYAQDDGNWKELSENGCRVQRYVPDWTYSKSGLEVICYSDKTKNKYFGMLERGQKINANPDNCLDTLEKAVQYAEKLEQDTSLADYKAPVEPKVDPLYRRSISEEIQYLRSQRAIEGYYNGSKDRFRPHEERKLLDSVYQKTV